MTDREQIDAFAADLEALVNHYRREFNLTLAAAVGALEIQKTALITDALRGDGDDDGEDWKEQSE